MVVKSNKGRAQNGVLIVIQSLSSFRTLDKVISPLFLSLVFFFFTTLCSMWDLSSRPGLIPTPPVLGAQSLNHWTSREVLILCFFNCRMEISYFHWCKIGDLVTS